MIYREAAVPRPMQRAAFCAWQFVLEPHDPPLVQHQVPPDGTTNLGLMRQPDGSLTAFQVGPTLAAFTVPVPQGSVSCGLRLRPEAAQAVTGRSPAVGHMEMLELDGRFAGVLRDLAAWAVGDPAPDFTASAALLAGTSGDEAIARSVNLLVGTGGTVPISSLCAGAGLSDRQFRRRFLAAAGVTPKQYADVQRVRSALIMALTEPSWAAVAHESGYADQPHLARSIKERFGSAACRVGGYFGGMRHELLIPGNGRKVQDAPATIG